MMQALHSWSVTTPDGLQIGGYRSLPSGKPLLHFMHGNGFCCLMYQPLLELLAVHFDLFLSDVQGHGQSPHGGDFIGWDACADVAAFAFGKFSTEYVGVPVIGCGHSFGAVVTALWASRTHQFQQLLLLDPVIFTPWMHKSAKVLQLFGLYRHNPLAKQARRRRQHWPDVATARQYFYQRGIFKQWTDGALDAYLTHALHTTAHGLSLRCDPSREAEIFASVPRRLWTELLQLQTPTHVIVGRQSYPFIQTSLGYWQQHKAQLSLDLVDGDHCFMQQHPSLCADLIISHAQRTKVL